MVLSLLASLPLRTRPSSSRRYFGRMICFRRFVLVSFLSHQRVVAFGGASGLVHAATGYMHVSDKMFHATPAGMRVHSLWSHCATYVGGGSQKKP